MSITLPNMVIANFNYYDKMYFPDMLDGNATKIKSFIQMVVKKTCYLLSIV